LEAAAVTDIAAMLQHIMQRATGIDALVENIARLSGGANMESSSFNHAGSSYVLRRAPSAEFMAGRVYGHDVEAAVVRAAFASGVKAPDIVAELMSQDQIGTGYIMRRVEAEVNPAAILAAAPPSLLNDLAREAARIHAIPLDYIPTLPNPAPAELLDEMKVRFVSYGGDRPIFALAFRWLQDHMPAPVEPVLLHGDFRMGNIMVDGDGLAAVLDWELAHLGDRHQDLAFGCINSWRFGHIDCPAFGVGQLDAFWEAYSRESGVAVEPERFRWWLVYSTLWWGLCCLQMAEIWRSGADASLERAVIGRRASETEVDLLMLLEGDAPKAERALIVLPEVAPTRRMGEPSSTEMLEALAKWVEDDVKPGAEGRDRFMASVAMNALGMLKREAEHSVEVHDKALSASVLAGNVGLATPGLLAKLKAAALIKLEADQPKYSALAKAREMWVKRTDIQHR
jgi:aminoglycoside phosphotransferase (APT) family kinase protein